jgi:plasmid stabilization system protein ParE
MAVPPDYIKGDRGQLVGSRRQYLTPQEERRVREAWADGGRRDEVAAAAGITVARLVSRLADQLADLPKRGRGVGGGRRRKDEEADGPDPTQDEIRLLAAECRRTWGPDRYGIGEPTPEDDPQFIGRRAWAAVPDPGGSLD